MKTWFMCMVKYKKEKENGSVKNVTERYLVDAMTFTEAEARIYKELRSIIRGVFMGSGIAKSKIIDIFHYDDSDVWYRCKISYMVAEESGNEKKITNYMLVTASDVKQAYERIHESLNNMLVTFSVPEIVETPIVEIFPYVSEEEKNQKVPANLRPLSEVQAEQALADEN